MLPKKTRMKSQGTLMIAVVWGGKWIRYVKLSWVRLGVHLGSHIGNYDTKYDLY